MTIRESCPWSKPRRCLADSVFPSAKDKLSKEENVKLAERQAKFIRSLKNALIRIENKTYGICRETGNLISPERLRLVPHATLSIEAKKSQ